MRLRVLGVLSLLTVVLVLVVSSVILSSASRELTQTVQINRVAALNRFAQLAYDAALDDDPTQLQREMDRYSALYGEGVLVRLPQGTLHSGGLGQDRQDVQDAVSKAGLNLNDTVLPPLRPFGTGPDVIARSFGTSSQVLGEAVLEVKLDAARQKLRERWLLVGLGAAAVWAVLLLGAAGVTRWVLRPVLRLDSAVSQLGATGTATALPEAGPPELRALSRSFSAMAHTVSESLESQRRLIADTSHELRNPVGALRLRFDLLRLELQTERQRNAADGVAVEMDRVEEILEGVLKLASAEHRGFEGAAWDAAGSGPGPALIDPFPVLQEEAERAEPAARLAGSSLVLGAAPEPPVQLACNAGELSQMVGELLTNAVKYAPGAHISVDLRTGPGSVEIEVSDDGPGLSAEERAASTTRFWRSPRHRQIRGTGLGMTIVERLAGANGGRLLLEERAPHGLVARLVFPRPTAEGERRDG
ncbi:HAMP domain-containing sensor histidine kinase [Arthrobacter ginkgonis]|uniref:histidine kinase n=1 Tax=Arthrobacter ginkgonis TaxID=1630594 RepID=A0ABP7CEG1_9MICC